MKFPLFHLGPSRTSKSSSSTKRSSRQNVAKPKGRYLYPSFLLAIVLLCIFILNSNPRRAQGQSTATSCCNQTEAPAPREIDFPYYSLSNGFTSTIYLVNVTPTPIDLTVAIHALSGQTVLAPILTIQGLGKTSVDLATLLTQLSADVTGTFAEGSVSIYFTGTIMPIAGQLTMTNPTQRMSFETEMVDNSPGLFLLPKQLNALWWGIGGGRDARLMVTNTSGSSASADVYLDFQGERHTSAALTFAAHETKVLSVTQMLGDLNVSPAQASQGGITIVPRDVIPTLLAQGRITDPVTGFSTTLNFLDPSLELSNTLHASGLPIGTPSSDSPYAGAGTFVPHVVVRNLLGTPQTVTITLEYPQPVPAGTVSTSTTTIAATAAPNIQVIPPRPVPGDANHHPEWGANAGATLGSTALATIPLGAYSTVDYSLVTATGQLPTALPYSSIKVQYSGPAGSAIAEVASVEAKGDLVVDGRMANEGNVWTASGANPWHLDSNTESIEFLTNDSNQICRIGFRVDTLGQSYFLTKVRLNPHETRAFNLRQLRDAQIPDFKGNLIPANATDGTVTWIHLDQLPVMGRLVVMRRNQGIASSYQCGTCPCPSYAGLAIDPFTDVLGDGFEDQYVATAEYTTCTSPYYSEITDMCAWTSDNSPVATVSTGMVTGVAAGLANIKASYTAPTFLFENNYCEPTGTLTETPTCPTNVDTFTFSITSGGVQSDSAGVVSGSQFNLKIQAKTASGLVPDPEFDAQNVEFSVVGENTRSLTA